MLHESVIDHQEDMRPTHLVIDLRAIHTNYDKIKQYVGGKKVMAVLKANAYGHGLIKVARHLEKNAVDYLGVAYLEEGIHLRKSGVKTPILVMGGIIGHQIPHFLNYNLTITASSVDKLNQIDLTAATMGKRARVHLKIDTGMERIGIHYYSANKLLEASLSCHHTDVEGIFSHFADADNEDLSFSVVQLKRFKDTLKFYDRHGIPRPITHMANSAAILRLRDSHFDMVRPGIILFGVFPEEHLRKHIEVLPVLTWKTRVVYFKVTKPGQPVSYGGTWRTNKMTRIVTLPVGYGDGYLRSMSNKAEVLIRGNRYPNVGNICMDQMMIDISWNTAYNNDEAVLIGRQGKEFIRVENLAEWAGTIPYEILTNINTRVPRMYVNRT